MRISELGRGALVRLKKSQALAKIDVFFPEKKEKKIVLKRRRPTKDFLHITPTSIMYISKLFCYKNVHFMY